MEFNGQVELEENTPVEIYKKVLSGELSKFPKNYFLENKEVGMERFKEIIRWLVLDYLKINESEIKEKVNRDFYTKYKLINSTKVFFNTGIKIKDYCFKKEMEKYQKKIKRKNKEKQLIELNEELRSFLINKFEKELNLSSDELINIISKAFLIKNKLGKLIPVFNYNLYKVIDFIYPNKYKHWQVSHVVWTDKVIKEAMDWLIFEKLNIKLEDAPKILIKRDFIENGMGNLLKQRFNNKISKIFNHVYKKDCKPWLFNEDIDIDYWNDENCKIAIKWLVEDVLKLSEENVYKYISERDFYENHLRCLYVSKYKRNMKDILKSIYPNLKITNCKKVYRKSVVIKKENRHSSITKYKLSIKEASKLIANAITNDFNMTPEIALKKLNSKDFMDIGLSHILNKYFNGNIKVAIYCAFPDLRN